MFSPFFNALPIRRLGLHERADSIDVADGLRERAGDVRYRGHRELHQQGRLDGIKLRSPVADTTVSVDADGFIVDYPGLAERI